MPLTGQAKTDYQREYMRRRRSNKKRYDKPESVRPVRAELVRPELEGKSPWQRAYILSKRE